MNQSTLSYVASTCKLAGGTDSYIARPVELQHEHGSHSKAYQRCINEFET